MDLIDSVKSGFRNYARFEGRASRGEYWWFTLFNIVAQLLASTINETLGLVVSLALIIPSIAVGVRRMHDVSKSGWWILFPVVNLLLACRKSTELDSPLAPNQDRPTQVGSPSEDAEDARGSNFIRSQSTTSHRETPRPQPRADSGYRYRNAPVSAVEACVGALRSAGVVCKIPTFEADIDRIIVASDLTASLNKQIQGLPQGLTPDMLKLLRGTEEAQAQEVFNERLASIIRQHLGPWLKK